MSLSLPLSMSLSMRNPFVLQSTIMRTLHTHCVYDHPLTQIKGRLYCRTCNRLRVRRYRALKRVSEACGKKKRNRA